MKICFLLLGTSLSLIPSLTFAQCVATQDCETLGYTETSCNGGKGVKCPFGNKWACLTSEEECLNLACDKLGFTYTCTGTGYSGGTGAACGGKYAACNCSDGYEWKNGSCQEILNGAQGELYYCNGTVVGVRATGMGFYVAMKDLGIMTWTNANSSCQSYAFCGNIKGTLPTRDQFVTIYSNKSRVNSLLSTNGGTQLTNGYYWSSTLKDSGNGYYVAGMSYGDGSWKAMDDNNYVRPILTSW